MFKNIWNSRRPGFMLRVPRAGGGTGGSQRDLAFRRSSPTPTDLMGYGMALPVEWTVGRVLAGPWPRLGCVSMGLRHTSKKRRPYDCPHFTSVTKRRCLWKELGTLAEQKTTREPRTRSLAWWWPSSWLQFSPVRS